MGELCSKKIAKMIPFVTFIFQLFLFCQAGDIVEKSPHWENLECERGHKYLFSEVTLSWTEARIECELYGGWLVDVNSLQEHNCLLRYGNLQGFNTWFWTDANDLESKGVWVHASTDTELTWINPRLDCCDAWDQTCFRADAEGAFMFGILDNKSINSAWCTNPINTERNFICEAQIGQ